MAPCVAEAGNFEASQSCSWSDLGSLVSFSFDTSRCSANLLALSSSVFFLWLLGFRWLVNQFQLGTFGWFLTLSSHLVWAYWLAVNLIILSQDHIPKRSFSTGILQEWPDISGWNNTLQLLYTIYRIYGVLYANIWRICAFHYVSYLPIILWIIILSWLCLDTLCLPFWVSLSGMSLENRSHLLLEQKSCSTVMVWVMEVLSIRYTWRWTVRRRCSPNSDGRM